MAGRSTLLTTLLWAVAFAPQATAHDHGPGSWINRGGLRDPQTKSECCNRNDCFEVPAGGLREENGGFLIAETGEHWPHARVLWQSQDGHWWRCKHMRDMYPIIKRGQTRCLIGPPPGS